MIHKDSYEVPQIFRLIAEKGMIEEQMMYNTFNMGIGMVLGVDAAQADPVIAAAQAAGVMAYRIGEAADGEKGVALC